MDTTEHQFWNLMLEIWDFKFLERLYKTLSKN
jgi:hypothetical protein